LIAQVNPNKLWPSSSSRLFSRPLFSPGGLLRKSIIREGRLIVDNRLNHFADVRAQQPIDRDAHKLGRIQDCASLDDRIDSLFLIRPKPDVYDSICHSSLPIRPVVRVSVAFVISRNTKRLWCHPLFA
jgi:hypothetical protein